MATHRHFFVIPPVKWMQRLMIGAVQAKHRGWHVCRGFYVFSTKRQMLKSAKLKHCVRVFVRRRKKPQLTWVKNKKMGKQKDLHTGPICGCWKGNVQKECEWASVCVCVSVCMCECALTGFPKAIYSPARHWGPSGVHTQCRNTTSSCSAHCLKQRPLWHQKERQLHRLKNIYIIFSQALHSLQSSFI